LVLAKQPNVDPNWLRYNFEAISILANFAITIAAIFIMTAFERVSEEERARISEFFARLAKPIDVDHDHGASERGVFSPFQIIGAVTIGTGLLLLVASIAQTGVGRIINFGGGLTICLIGAGLYRLHQRYAFQAMESSALTSADNEAKPTAGR
jgi:hypothetical protein